MRERPASVLVVIGQLGRGGAERQVFELATRLDPRRFRPVVATLEAGGAYEPLLRRGGVEVRVIDKRGWREATAPARLAASARDTGAAIVHAYLYPASWRSVLSAGLAGVRSVICSVRSTGSRMEWGRALLERAALRRARLVIANAPAVADDVARRSGVPRDRIRTVLNGVDLSSFHPGGSPLRDAWRDPARPRAPLVGFVGSLREAKDPLLFVHAAAIVARSEAETRFVMVGDGPLRPAVEALARSRGLDGRLRLAGERSDVPDVLRALDLLVVTSRREGCCNVVMEAMASGVPVAATSVGGNSDLIRDGADGLLFPHGDPQAAAARIAGVLDEPALGERLARAGLSRARESFGVDAMVAATSRIYEELL